MVNKKITKLYQKIHLPKWLIIVLVLCLLLRIPSFFEPYSYGDEMIYLTLGQAIRQKVALYSNLHDNKPPLLYLTAALAGSLFWLKAILAFWNFMTIVLFWNLSKVLFSKNVKLQRLSTIIFAILTTIPLLEGNIANAEIFMIAPTIYAFTILLSKRLSKKNLFLSGVLFSTSTLFKVPAAFDMPAILFLWLALSKLNVKNIKVVLSRTAVLLAGFIFPLALTFIWYFFKGALYDYSIAAFLQNVGYLSTFRPEDVQQSFIVRNAPLLIRAGIVATGLAILFFLRKKLSKQFIFLSSWLVLSLFAVALSERPYPHYLIQSVPAISLLIGILLTKKSLEQSLTIIPLSLAFLVPVYFNFWHYPVASYYIRFYKLATKQLSVEEYRDAFGGHINNNYEIANFIRMSTKSDERIYVWGDTAIIYALSKRLPPIKYVADYHINDFSSKEEVAQKLSLNLPKLIIILPNSPAFPELTPLLKQSYLLMPHSNGVEIWNKLPGSL